MCKMLWLTLDSVLYQNPLYFGIQRKRCAALHIAFKKHVFAEMSVIHDDQTFECKVIGMGAP
jgi:hypothetical protein